MNDAVVTMWTDAFKAYFNVLRKAKGTSVTELFSYRK